MRPLLPMAVAGLALLVAVPLIAQDQMSPEEQRDWFVQFVEGQLSTPERQIRISNIDGVLSSQASIRQVTISDQDGIWLTINNAAIDWDQGALFTGRLLVRELKAESIDYRRNAAPSTDVNLPPPEATPFQVPEFPVAIQLDKLSIPKVTFGAGVFGLGSEISVEGNLKLEGGSLDTALAIDRLDGPGGKLDLALGYRNADDNVDIAVTLTEPPDGILANLLNIEGRPEIALSVVGQGPINDLRTTMALDAAGQRALEGAATIAEAGDGLAVNVDLGGPVAGLMAPAYRSFFGADTRLQADILVRSAGGVEIPSLKLTGGQLALEGSAATAEDGFLSRLNLRAAIADPAGAAVLLPVPGASTSIESASLVVSFGEGSSEDWTANIEAKGFSNGDLAARDLTVAASGIAANLTDPEARRVTFNADGSLVGIASKDPSVQAALGDSAGFGLAGLWTAGQPLQLAELRLVGKALTLALTGTFADSVFNGRLALETQSIAPFSGLAGRKLDGAMSLAATGTANPLTGGFDLVLDGTAGNLRLSEPALDKLLAGNVQLSGRVARTEQGLVAENFRLGNANVELRADGSYATERADFDFSATLADLKLVSPDAAGRLELTGSAKGQGTIALNVEARVPQGRLAGKGLANAVFGFGGNLAPNGALSGALRGDAMLDGHRVDLSGDVAIDAERRRLDGLRFEAGPTVLTGDLVQDAAGLVTGRLQLASPDISAAAALAMLKATGSANAAITLSAANGQQAADVTGRIENLRAEGVAVGSADLSGSLRDLFGAPAIDGTVSARAVTAGGFTVDRIDGRASQSGATTGFTLEATMESDRTLAGAGITPLRATARGSLTGRMITLDGLSASGRGGLEISGSGRVPLEGNGMAVSLTGSAPLALANRFVAERGGQFSGTATLRAELSGSLANPQFGGTVSTGGAGYVDPELNLRLVDIGGSASLSGQRLVIDSLSAGLATGGSVSVGGSVGLAAGNEADLSLRLNHARYADGALLVATVSGDLALRGPLAGSSLLSGNVVVEKADITVPESFGGTAALVDTVHRNTPASVAATLARAHVDERGRPAAAAAPSDIRLDVNVQAPNQIFVRGRGLDAEVGGAVRLTGSLSDIQPVGGFSLSRGRLAILGQRVTFEEGSVTLVGDLDPYLDFTARTEGDGITVFVNVNGRVSDLAIGFSSNPPLPQDEVLSRLLFKRAMGELTPLQLAKLAGAAAELAGGSNSSLVDSLRARAGLADLDLVTGEDGSLAVQAGTYLQDNIYLGVQAGADGQSRVTINLDLTDDIRAKASTGTNGDTSLGIFYEKDY